MAVNFAARYSALEDALVVMYRDKHRKMVKAIITPKDVAGITGRDVMERMYREIDANTTYRFGRIRRRRYLR